MPLSARGSRGDPARGQLRDFGRTPQTGELGGLKVGVSESRWSWNEALDSVVPRPAYAMADQTASVVEG